jgi:hypothetical protein
VVTTTSIALCAAIVGLWVWSHSRTLGVAWAHRRATSHFGVRDGSFWLTRAGDWPDRDTARRVAASNPSARPILVARWFRREVQQVEQSRQFLLDHAAFLRRRLGATDPEAAAEAAGATAVRERLREDVYHRAAGVPGVPIVSDRPGDLRRSLGLTFERGTASFLTRDPADGTPIYTPPTSFSATGIPCWMPLALFAAWPLIAAALAARRARTRRVRRRRGLCPTCGYDLRATGDADGRRFDRCPECGTARPAPVAVALPVETGAPE